MIIQRIAALLQPGDILPTSGGLPRRVITQIGTVPGMGQPDAVVAYVTRLGAYPAESAFKPPPEPDHFRPDALVDVEVPDLTPAQARAEELLDLLDDLANIDDGATRNKAIALVNELRPKPPTIDEVLSELNESYERACAGEQSDVTNTVRVIIDRARRTGLL